MIQGVQEKLNTRLPFQKATMNKRKALFTSILDLNLGGGGGNECSDIFGTRRCKVLEIEH